MSYVRPLKTTVTFNFGTDTYIRPLKGAVNFNDGVAPPPTGRTLNIWNGTSFVTASLKYYNGTSWVLSTDYKYYNGTSWL